MGNGEEVKVEDEAIRIRIRTPREILADSDTELDDASEYGNLKESHRRRAFCHKTIILVSDLVCHASMSMASNAMYKSWSLKSACIRDRVSLTT